MAMLSSSISYSDIAVTTLISDSRCKFVALLNFLLGGVGKSSRLSSVIGLNSMFVDNVDMDDPSYVSGGRPSVASDPRLLTLEIDDNGRVTGSW